MENNGQFEYTNETSIDPELICIICNSPFEDPRCTPCDHTFCYECITNWIRTNNASCPTCRQPVRMNGLTQANRTVRNMLDRLLVTCPRCGQTGVQRENFNDHFKKTCPKINVSCSAADGRCPWTGPRDQLDSHLASCVFHALRSLLGELIVENRQLREQVMQQKAQSDDLQNQVRQLQEQFMEHTIKINELQIEDERQNSEMANVDQWGCQHEDEMDQLWDNINR
jgi:hypothetical protein